MKCFRIYTEDKNQSRIKELINIGFDGFTVIRAAGYYKGVPEKAIIIEIYTENETLIRELAKVIKKRNKQESVLVARFDADFSLI